MLIFFIFVETQIFDLLHEYLYAIQLLCSIPYCVQFILEFLNKYVCVHNIFSLHLHHYDYLSCSLQLVWDYCINLNYSASFYSLQNIHYLSQFQYRRHRPSQELWNWQFWAASPLAISVAFGVQVALLACAFLWPVCSDDVNWK